MFRDFPWLLIAAAVCAMIGIIAGAWLVAYGGRPFYNILGWAFIALNIGQLLSLTWSRR